MKASELMIGDWVLVDDTPVQMHMITANGQYDVIRNGVVSRILNDNETAISPIPLTAEILKKNDIVLLEVGDNGPATPPAHRNRYEKWFIHTTWSDTHLWYDRHTERWHLRDMGAARFRHVHELQLALRLSGIKKEISL